MGQDDGPRSNSDPRPVAAFQVLLVAWAIAAEVGPEVHTRLVELITIVALVIALNPVFKKLHDRADRSVNPAPKSEERMSEDDSKISPPFL
jgi:hypothetical protein